ncbi:MAG: hypothetical protein R6U13_03625 [Desulfatiglandaceae bacterium]
MNAGFIAISFDLDVVIFHTISYISTSSARERRTEIMGTTFFLYVATADQCFPLMRPIIRNLGSSRFFAEISRISGSRHSRWASTKSIPCVAKFERHLSSSYSNSGLWYKKYTHTVGFATVKRTRQKEHATVKLLI